VTTQTTDIKSGGNGYDVGFFLPAHPRPTLCSWYRSTIHLLNS